MHKGRKFVRIFTFSMAVFLMTATAGYSAPGNSRGSGKDSVVIQKSEKPGNVVSNNKYNNNNNRNNHVKKLHKHSHKNHHDKDPSPCMP